MKRLLHYRKDTIWIFFLVLLSFSCQQTSRKPGDILSHQEMVKLLAEIYITEEKINRIGISTDSAARVFDVMQEKIAEKTGVPDSVFKKSMEYYTDHPKELEMIYSVLIDSLQLREQRTDARANPQ